MSSRKPAQPRPGEPIRLVFTSNGTPRYRVVLDVSRKGDPRHQVTSTHRSLTEARDHVIQVRADVSPGKYAAPVRVTFKSLSTEYLARVERGDHGRKAVRASTLAGYRAAMARVNAIVGDRPVTDLTYRDIAGMVDTMAQTHAHKSVALALTLVRSTLAYAVRERMIPSNPAVGVSPKGADPVQRQAYTPEQVRALSHAAADHRLAGVFALILLGLRRGEALGVRWADVDLTAGLLIVSRSRVWLAGGPVDNPPKTKRGERSVALDTVTVERLRAMRATHAEERLVLGVGLSADDVLAANEDGTALRPETLAAEWRALCERASKAEQEAERDPVPDLGLHAARHAQVKMLRAAGLPDGVIAVRLGHDENVMRAVYGVPQAAEQDKAAEVMARLLG